jgi:beta-glucosidase
MNHLKREDFGDDFNLGVATSAYQVEGAHRADDRGLSIWDVFSHTPGNTRDGDTGDVACDHYNRYEQDVALIEWIGADAYRFSIAWPRVIPDGRGSVNEKGLDFYDRLVDALLDKGIKSVATLYHWDLPAALAGGWLNRDTTDAFAEFTIAAARRLGDRVTMWFTHNEPWCQAFLGYEKALFAPGHTSFEEALLCAHHLLVSHGKAVEALHGEVRAPVGPALNFIPSHPASAAPADIAAAKRYDGYFNRWFLEPIAGRGYPDDMIALYGDLMPVYPSSDMDIIAEPVDVMGVNYYERGIFAEGTDDDVLKIRYVKGPGPRTADREIYPEGIAEVLTRLHREYGFEHLVVTENGAAFHETPASSGVIEDNDRVAFLEAHLEVVKQVRAEGIPVKGYFAWSLMDNFEWSEGYAMRYGITYVDFKTQKRTPKKSAHFLRSLKRS